MLNAMLVPIVLLGMLSPAAALGAQGVTDKEIVFGQTAGFTGPVAGSVKESTDGALLYFDWINSQGGLNGRKIVLTSHDDKFDPKLAAENVKKMIDENPPIAFILTRGTAHTEAIMPYATAAGIPVVAPGTGAEIFHQPVNPLVFNVRSKYQLEVEKAVEYLSTVGIRRIAMVHVADSFGADALAGFQRKMDELHLEPVLVTSFDRVTGDTAAAAQAVVKVNPQATFAIGNLTHVSSLIDKVRKAGNQTTFATLSVNSARAFIKALGPNSRGVMVVQVFPNPASSSQIAREMRRLSKDKKDFIASQQAMEGFITAKMLVEALKRAGNKLSSKSLTAALNGMKEVDLGGFWISYSPSNHTGGKFVEMSIIDARGEFIQ